MERPNDLPANCELVKCVVVGDSGVGKTRLICSRACGTRYTLPQLMQTHIPTVWAIDTYYRSPEVLDRSCCDVDGIRVSLRLWDTFGYHDKDRRFAFSKADVVLLCYSTVRPVSLKSAQLFWYPEIRRVCPSVPIVLVGCQIDLRYLYNDPEFLALDKGLFFHQIADDDIILPETGRQVAADINAEYFETSALTQYGIEHTFENVIRIALIEKAKSRFINPQLKNVNPPICQTPALPPPNRAPNIQLAPSTLVGDFHQLLRESSRYDVLIIVRDEEILAHRFVLASSSPLFHTLFSMDLTAQIRYATQNEQDDASDSSVTLVPNDSVCLLSVAKQQSLWIELTDDLFSAIAITMKNSRPITSLLVRPEVGFEACAFRLIIEFMYTGDFTPLNSTQNSSLHSDTTTSDHAVFYALARTLNIESLVKGLQCRDEVVGPVDEVGRHFLLDRTAAMTDLILNKGFYSDVLFRCEDGDLAGHRALLVARCEWMNSLLNQNFRERSLNIIPLPGVHLDTLRCMQTYLYTDSLPTDFSGVDIVDLLELTNRFCLKRLLALIQIEVIAKLKLAHENGEDIIEDVLELLDPARAFNASHLAAWCMVFLCNNYYAMLKKKPRVFTALYPDVQRYLVQHRWPPEWYVRELEYTEKQLRLREMSMKPHRGVVIRRRYKTPRGCLCFPGCRRRQQQWRQEAATTGNTD